MNKPQITISEILEKFDNAYGYPNMPCLTGEQQYNIKVFIREHMEEWGKQMVEERDEVVRNRIRWLPRMENKTGLTEFEVGYQTAIFDSLKQFK